MITNPTNEHREQARALLAPWRIRLEHGDSRLPGLLADVIAEALSSRDTEIREVLEGLRNDGGCWCPYVDDTRKCGSGCDAARALYARLRPPEEKFAG